MQQEQRMKELLELEQQKEREKEIEKQQKMMKKMESMQIREKIIALRSQFENYVPDSSKRLIELHIRLPTGRRVSQVFEKSRSVLFVKNFILQLENNGIVEDLDDEEEEEDDVYAIDILWGFPPKTLNEAKRLAQVFGESTGEAVTVKLA